MSPTAAANAAYAITLAAIERFVGKFVGEVLGVDFDFAVQLSH
jgi:hypothetical protein